MEYSQKTQSYKDNAMHAADAFTEKAKRAAQDVADSTRGFANKVADWTETHKYDVSNAFDEGSQRTRAFVKNKPFVSLALVVGVSALAAYWIAHRNSDSY